MTVDSRVDQVLGAIDDSREELARLCLELANTYSPFGAERAVAERVHAWYCGQGLRSSLVEMTEQRANVVARLPGTGAGPSILFNAHLDTEASGPDFDRLMQVPDPNRIGGRREGDRFFGHTMLNDRHGHGLFMIAARALRDSGVELAGDVVLTSVAGETGSAPVDEYQGIAYEGKGLGTRFLVDHGVRASYGVVAETTNFALCWHNCGALYVKVTLRGRNMYTPRLQRPDGDITGHPNAIVKAAHAVGVIEEWAIAFERERTGTTPCGEVRPKAQVGAVRGGIPWRPNRSAPYCALYLDIRTLPGEEPAGVIAALRRALDGGGVEAEIDLVMAKPGAVGQGVEPLIAAVTAAHEAVRGAPPPDTASPAVVSMWRDNNVLNHAGIPSLTFGPGRGRAPIQGEGFMELDDMVAGAKMYALAALQIAGGVPAGALA